MTLRTWYLVVGTDGEPLPGGALGITQLQPQTIFGSLGIGIKLLGESLIGGA